MKKNKLQIGILAVCFLLLIGVYVFLVVNEGNAEKEEEDAKFVVNAMNSDAVTGFSYTYQGEEISIEKVDDVWMAAGDSERELIQEDVQDMFNQALSIYGNQEITDVTDFVQYGFDEPIKTITLKTTDGNTVFEIGAVNDITGDYYIRKVGDSKVYTVGSSLYYNFEQSIDDLTQTEESGEKSVEETEN